jgi:hypothetical protein
VAPHVPPKKISKNLVIKMQYNPKTGDPHIFSQPEVTPSKESANNCAAIVSTVTNTIF